MAIINLDHKKKENITMTVKRYLNDIPITQEELYTKRITNDTLNRIFTNVKKRTNTQGNLRNIRKAVAS